LGEARAASSNYRALCVHTAALHVAKSPVIAALGRATRGQT
jgi:hypothetical protein